MLMNIDGVNHLRKSWRDVIPEHKTASLFPMVAPEERKALGTDIKIRGLVSPIAITAHMRSDGTWKYQLLDGRNRLEAMEYAGIEFTLVLEDGKCKIKSDMDYLKEGGFYPEAIVVPEEEALAYVISVNMRRRHLTCEQRRDVIAKLIEAQPVKSDRQIAEQIKASPSTVGKVRKELEHAGAVSKLHTRTDSKGRKQPAHKLVTGKNHTVDDLIADPIESVTPADITKSAAWVAPADTVSTTTADIMSVETVSIAPASITEPVSECLETDVTPTNTIKLTDITDAITPTDADNDEELESDVWVFVHLLEEFRDTLLSRVKEWTATHPGVGYGTGLYSILDEIHCETGTVTLDMMRGRTVKEVAE